MEINWNKIAIYSIGGAAGAVVGVFVANFIMDVVATQKRLKEMQEMEVDEEAESEEADEHQVLTNGWKVRDRVNYSDKDKADLSEIVKKYKKNEEETPEEPDHTQYVDETAETVVDVDRTKPYPISSEQFVKGVKGYKNTKIVFYADDEVFTDEGGAVLSKPEKYLGVDVINMFGGPGYPEIAYIRNEKLKCDYNVVLIDEAYQAVEEAVVPSLRRKNVDRD